MTFDALHVTAAPLTPEAFAPFGEVIEIDGGAGRRYFDAALGDDRATARPSLSVIDCEPAYPPRVTVDMLERHPHSSQSFVPLTGGRYLVVVAPANSAPAPEMKAVRAFIALPTQGITFRRGTWHRALTVLDVPGRHAIFMWRDGGSADEEFAAVPPFDIIISAQHP